MDTTRLGNILSELLEAQQQSLLPRLMESTVFVTAQTADEMAAVRRLVDEHDQDVRRLADALLAAGGQPLPAVGQIVSADFHYVDLHILLPRVLADQERLAARYAAAAPALSGAGPAAEVVRDIAAGQRVRTEYIRKLADSTAAGIEPRGPV